MQLERIAIGKLLGAAFTLDGLIGCVEFLNVNTQVGLTAASRRAEFALKHGLIAHRVNELVSLKGVGLGETSIADVAWVMKRRLNSEDFNLMRSSSTYTDRAFHPCECEDDA